jgi:hypothetical protein
MKLGLRMILLAAFITINMNAILGQQATEIASPDAGVSEGSLILKVSSPDINKSDDFSKVYVIKSVVADNEKLNFKYSIRTPVVDNFDFVLALDSSGSLGEVGSPEQKEAICEAVPEFINTTMNEYPDTKFRMSIMSWDDNIDFTYSDFNNTDPKKVKLIPIRQAYKDIISHRVFDKNDKNKTFDAESYENTNLSVPLSAAIDIFNNNPKSVNSRTSRFIILVVSEGEYTPCKEELIKNIYNLSTISAVVYVIGMPFNERNEMLAHLESICLNNNSRIQTISSPKNELNSALYNALNKALKNATSEPVAENVKLIDSFGGYIHPSNQASAKIVREPKKDPTDYQMIDINSDPKAIEFRLPYGLLPNTTTEVIFPADFALMRLPTSTTGNFEGFLSKYGNNNSTSSALSYLWIRSELCSIPIEGNELNFESATLNTMSAPSNNTARSGPPKESGYSETGFITIICTVAMIIALRSKR